MITESTEISNALCRASRPQGPAGLVISLDFELRWGVRDLPNEAAYHRHLLAAREAIPPTLQLFRKYGVHATWATVGMLLFDSKRELLKQLPDLRPTYDRPQLSPYDDFDGVGADEKSDPLHFGRSLGALICETPSQELASHTFCHYYCLESGQTTAQFRADLEGSVQVNRQLSGQSPRSIVFPRNQCSRDHIDVCHDLGIDVYRGTETHWAYRANAGAGFNTLPKRLTRLADSFLPITGSHPIGAELMREEGGTCNVPSSRFFRPRFGSMTNDKMSGMMGSALESLRIRRITGAMQSTIKAGQGFHLWWHPHNFGGDVAGNLASLEQVLKAFDELRQTEDAQSYTMSEFADAACL